MSVVRLYGEWEKITEPWLRDVISRSGLGDGLSQDEIEDAIGEARDIAIERTQDRDVQHPARFLGVVALNAIRRWRRMTHRRFARELIAAHKCALADEPFDDPVKLFAKSEVLRALSRTLDQIPPDEHCVIDLVYGEGLLLRDAAMRLGIPASTASDRHLRAIRRIRSALRKLVEHEPVVALAVQEAYGEGALTTLFNSRQLATPGG